MRVLVRFDQRGEHIKGVCLLCMQIMACQYVDHLSSVIEFHIVVNRPEWMYREELSIDFGDIFISHQRRILAPFLAHSSSFHVSLVYSACVRNRRTNTFASSVNGATPIIRRFAWRSADDESFLHSTATMLIAPPTHSRSMDWACQKVVRGRACAWQRSGTSDRSGCRGRAPRRAAECLARADSASQTAARLS